MAMCRACRGKWSQGADGLCRSCHREVQQAADAAEAEQYVGRMAEHVAAARARRQASQPPQAVLRTVVIDGRWYDVVFDGAVRDVEACG
ncbi:MAG: hypothetical protein V4597_08415 [Pseudomonadota bacterium]